MKKCQPESRAYRVQKTCASISVYSLLMLTLYHPQEAEAEKASVLEQYADLAARKAVVDEQQTSLLKELNGIKEQIRNFEQHRSEIMVSTPPCLLHGSKRSFGAGQNRRGRDESNGSAEESNILPGETRG